MVNGTDNKQISKGTRLGAMFLDHFFMTMIVMIFFIPQMISGFTDVLEVTHEQTNPDFISGPFSYISILGFALYLCKDCIDGRSIAKRILNLQVVDNLTGQVATPIKCLIRNLSIVFWPIEAIVALTNTNRRLGDRIAGTKLVILDKTQEQAKFNTRQVLIPVAIAYGLILLLMLPFKGLVTGMEEQKINYVEASYNAKSSKETEKLFADSLGQNLTASVKVYDQIQNKPLKYISVIFQLQENDLEDDQNFEQIKSLTLPLLLSKFPEKTFIGQIKYVYQTSSSMLTRTIPLDWTKER